MNTNYMKIEPIAYPVGQFFASNQPIIKAMGEYIYLNILEKYSVERTIVLVCRGSSGAIIAGSIAVLLIENGCTNVRIAHVKKPGEESHHSTINLDRYQDPVIIIVDDFISTGRTLKAIFDAIDKCYYDLIHIVCTASCYRTFEADLPESFQAIMEERVIDYFERENPYPVMPF